MIEDHNIAKRRREEAATVAKKRREEAAAAAVPPSATATDVAPVRDDLAAVPSSTTATDVAPVRNDFIPPSSIGVSQEATDTHSVTKTMTNIAGNTNGGNIPPSTTATNVAPVRNDFIPPIAIGVSQEATDTRSVTKTLTDIAGNTNDGNIPPSVIAADAVCNTEKNNPLPTGKIAQHSFRKKSGMFCEKVSYFGQAQERSNEDREEEKYGFGRIIEVPNKKTWHITSLNTIVLFMRMIL